MDENLMCQPVVALRLMSRFLLGFAVGYALVSTQACLERIEAKLVAMEARLTQQYVPWRTSIPWQAQPEQEEAGMPLD
jgi:hypothetical protein